MKVKDKVEDITTTSNTKIHFQQHEFQSYIYTHQSSPKSTYLLQYQNSKSGIVEKQTQTLEQMKQTLIKLFEKNNGFTEELQLGISYFTNERERKTLVELQQYVNQRMLELNLKKFFLEAKFMNLHKNGYKVISNFLRIINPSLQSLNINLKGNYLKQEGVRNILIDITKYFTELTEFGINLSSNGTNKSSDEDNQSLLYIFDMPKLQKLDLDVCMNRQQIIDFNYIFKHKQGKNPELKEIRLNISDTNEHQDIYGGLLQIFPSLEKIEIIADNNQMKIKEFINRISKSKLKHFTISLQRAQFDLSPEEIMKLLFQSKHLVSIDVNFRFTSTKQDCVYMLKNIASCSNLQRLAINIQNNHSDKDTLVSFQHCLEKGGQYLSHFNLNILNDFLQQNYLIKKYLIRFNSKTDLTSIERAIIMLPNILFSSLQFSSEKKTEDQSFILKQFSNTNEVNLLIAIVFENNIKQQMIFNPIFIFQDLYL